MTSHAAGRRTTLWVRETDAVADILRDRRNPFLPEYPLPSAIAVTDDLAAALAATQLVIVVVPSQFLRSMCRQIGKHLAPGVPIVVCSKGIEADSGCLMNQVIEQELPGHPLAVLSGPSFAAEVAAGQPTAVTVASADLVGATADSAPQSLAARVAVTLATASFRPYLSDDVVGVEVGGAVKNVLAIACGIAQGRGMGSNPRAALLTRGLAEIKRLAEALGGQRETVSGLAGIGDLTLTCSSEQSRNFSFGKALGEGRRADDLLANRSSVVEGVVNARSVVALAARLGVDMPICQAVDRVLHGGLSIDAAIELLMVRPLRAESAGLEQLIALPHPSA
jgi:glycerol-3-phosphate dehydrogenase (NAD(P)+)